MSKKKKARYRGVKIFLLLMAVLFVCVFAAMEVRTYRAQIAGESFDSTDFYSMQGFASKNSEKVLSALSSGNMKKLSKLIGDAEGAEEVMRFADWRKADLDKAVSYGAGCLSTSADSRGRTEIAEKYVVQANETKYVIYIETLTSRWGRKNEGVSAVGVTTYSHYKELDGNWNGDKDEESALAGTLFRDSEEQSKEKESNGGD